MDNIQIIRQAGGERWTYEYLSESRKMTFSIPDTAGAYEFQYVFRDNEVIHVQPITLTLDRAQAGADTSDSALALDALAGASCQVPVS